MTLFSVLGPVTVTLDGERVRLGGRRQVAALAQLLINRGQVVSMDQLIDGVWDGESPNRPDVTIRSYLSNLRRTIEPWRPKGDRVSCIQSCAPGYRLAVGPESLDADRFEIAVTDARKAMAGGDSRRVIELMQGAQALWRGEAYEGVPDNDSILATRSRLSELQLVAAELLAEARLAAGDHETVITDLDPLVGEHPLRERLTELSMLALYRAGRQSEALLVCTRLRSRLVERLGLDPGPRIQELESKILSQDASLLPTGTGHRLLERPTRPFERSTTVVGRAAEQQALDSIRTTLAGDLGATALITGEPGSGKSTLADELCRALEGTAVAAWGRCLAVAADQPLWPWGQAIDAVVSQLPELGLDGLDSLGDVVPGWPSARHGVAPSGDRQVAPSRHFPAVVKLLRRAVALRPLVVVIDDAHWSDESSIELLAHAGNSLGDLPIGFVVAWRNTELRARQPRHALRQLVRMPSMVRIELGGLDRRSVGVLAAAAGVPDEAVDQLYEMTAGNPLFVNQLIAGWTSSAPPAPDDRVGFEPTSNVRDLILERVDAAHPEAAELLPAAALCRQPFSPSVIGDAVGFDRSTLEDALDAVVSAGLVAGVEGDEWAYRFIHPITAVVLREQLSSPKRARLQTSLGRSAWRLSRPPGEVAHHFAAAGSTGTSILAARFALESVAGSLACGDLAAAAGIIERGLAELDRLDNTASLKVDFGAYLAQWARMTGDHERAADLLAEVVSAAASPRATESDRVRSSLLASGAAAPGPLSTHLDWLGQTAPLRPGDEAHRRTPDGGVAAEPPAGPPGADSGIEFEIAWARQAGRLALSQGSNDERAAAAGELAALLAPDAPGPDHLLVVRLDVLSRLAGGSPIDVEREIDELVGDATAESDSLLWLDAAVLRATVDTYQGRLDRAEQALDRVQLFCRRWGLDTTGSVDRLHAFIGGLGPVLDLREPITDATDWPAERRLLEAVVAPLDARETPARWCRLSLTAPPVSGTEHHVALEGLLALRSTIITSHRGLVFLGPGSYYAAHAALATDELALAEELVDETEQHGREAKARPLLAWAQRLRAEIGRRQHDPSWSTTPSPT